MQINPVSLLTTSFRCSLGFIHGFVKYLQTHRSTWQIWGFFDFARLPLFFESLRRHHMSLSIPFTPAFLMPCYVSIEDGGIQFLSPTVSVQTV
jgi:hypothetical protein